MVRAGRVVVMVDQGFYNLRERDIMVRVKAKPGSRVDRIAGIRGDCLAVEVRAAPERGKANEAVARVLAEALGIKSSAVELRSGHAAPRKLFVVPLEARGALERLGREFA